MRLLYFAPVLWDSYDQRPHYFARRFLEAGGEAVWWINPYPARLPRWSDVTRADRRQPSPTLARPAGLTVVDVAGLPVDPLPGGARLNHVVFWRDGLARMRAFAAGADTVLGIGRPTALARSALSSIPCDWSFYDAMDDFPEFYDGLSKRSTARVERAIAGRVDRIFASSRHLADKFSSQAGKVALLPNAFDMTRLPPVSTRLLDPPALGFIGCMGRWFDWDLVGALAETVTPMPVVLVGPRPTAPPRQPPDNVALHPPCSQDDAVERLAWCSAGLIPFRRTRLTEGIDPIKYYLYRASSLPVLSTRFGAMAMRTAKDHTFFLDDPAGVRSAVDSALGSRPSGAEVERFRADHSWTRRFDDAGLF